MTSAVRIHAAKRWRAWLPPACGAACVFGLSAHAGPVLPSTEEAVARGLVYMMQPYPQADGLQGFGCGFADLDGDGDSDIILLGAANGRVGIFENDGAGYFTDRSLGTGIPVLASASGLVAGDYDGDGDIDLLLTQLGEPNVLVRNLGSFTFEDVSATAGIDDPGSGTGACLGDFDGDGWLDLYVCNYNGAVFGTELIDNKLYRNDQDGTFTEVGVAQTVDNPGYGFQAVWFDLEFDGDLDLYLSNDRGHLFPNLPNQLWRNDNGQLVNISSGSGADLGLFSMGLATGDLDGNGFTDLYCTNVPGGGGVDNPLFLNLNGALFLEWSVPAGVNNPFVSWGSVFYDFDNNSHLDLYVNNMFVDNTLYLNSGSFPCAEIALSANVGANSEVSHAAAVGDVDGDGDLDLLVNNLQSNVQLFINHEGQQREWIKYHVVGRGANTGAVGARVNTRTGSQWQLREIYAGGNGYLGQNELVVHVGLDAAMSADEVVITWPGGAPVRTLTKLPSKETWTLYPPERLGDADGDLAVLLDDFFTFSACFDAGFQPGCEMMDFDGNSVIDLDDFDSLLAVYADPLHDCDGNLQLDLLDILLDPGLDTDADGLPDACEAMGDVNGDGTIGIVDLLIVLGAWGPCPDPPATCTGDTDGDGAIGVTDLLTVLGNWG